MQVIMLPDGIKKNSKSSDGCQNIHKNEFGLWLNVSGIPNIKLTKEPLRSSLLLLNGFY